MLRKTLLFGAMFFTGIACILLIAADDAEKITIPMGGMKIIDLPFKSDNFRSTNQEIIKVDAPSDQQIRIVGLKPGKADLHVMGDKISKIYTVTVQDNIRELYSAIKKDLDALPELDISINRDKIVLKGEVSSITGWETLNKVLPHYKDVVLNLAIFRPAPEVMLNLKKAFEKAGYEVVQDAAQAKPGQLTLNQTGGSLMLSGAVYSPDEIPQIKQMLATQNWLAVDGKGDSADKVKLVENLRVVPALLDVGVVFVGIRSSEGSTIGANLTKNGIPVGNAFNFGTDFASTSKNYNLNASLQTIVNLLAEGGTRRFRNAGHLTFISNESPTFKMFQSGGTLKVRVYGGAGGTGTLNDVPYGFIMKVKGGLNGANKVKLDVEMEMSTPVLMENNDYDLKQSKVSTTITANLGQTVVLSGMKDIVQETTEPSGVPFLRKAPVLNWFCSESSDRLDDNQVLILLYPQVAQNAPELKMPPSAETSNTLSEGEKTNQQRTKEKNEKKSFWERIF